jgi:hypothetical protein
MRALLLLLLLCACGEKPAAPEFQRTHQLRPPTLAIQQAPSLNLTHYGPSFGFPQSRFDCAVDDSGNVYIVTEHPSMLHRLTGGGVYEYGVAVDDTTISSDHDHPRGVAWDAGRVYVATFTGHLFCFRDEDGTLLWGNVQIPTGPISNGWHLEALDVRGDRWVAINGKDDRRVATGRIVQ